MSETQLSHLHSTDPERAAGLQPPAAFVDAATASPRELSLITEWSLQALTENCHSSLPKPSPLKPVTFSVKPWCIFAFGDPCRQEAVAVLAGQSSSLKCWLSHIVSYCSSICEAQMDRNHCEMLVALCIPITYSNSSAMLFTIFFTCSLSVFRWFCSCIMWSALASTRF